MMRVGRGDATAGKLHGAMVIRVFAAVHAGADRGDRVSPCFDRAAEKIRDFAQRPHDGRQDRGHRRNKGIRGRRHGSDALRPIAELLLTGGSRAVLTGVARICATPAELANVKYNVSGPRAPWIGLAGDHGPLVLVRGDMLFAGRRMSRGSQAAIRWAAFGRSRARVAQANETTITFVDVAGVDEPRQDCKRSSSS